MSSTFTQFIDDIFDRLNRDFSCITLNKDNDLVLCDKYLEWVKDLLKEDGKVVVVFYDPLPVKKSEIDSDTFPSTDLREFDSWYKENRHSAEAYNFYKISSFLGTSGESDVKFILPKEVELYKDNIYIASFKGEKAAAPTTNLKEDIDEIKYMIRNLKRDS